MLRLLIAAALAVSPALAQSSVEDRFNHAVELQRGGALKEAAEEYLALLKIDPNYAEAHANLGAIMAQWGQYQRAIASYEAALRLDPSLKPVLLNLGIAHYRAAQFRKAVGALQQFLKEKPDSLQAQQLLGLSLVELGRDADAVAQLEPTLAAAPGDAAVLYGLGTAYLRLGRSDFREMAQRLAAIPSGLAASHLLSGQSLLASGDYKRANEAFQAAAKLNSNFPRLSYWLGYSQMLLGERQEALASFEHELSERPQDFWTLYQLASLLEAERNLFAARKRLEVALRIEPRSPEANALLGKILFKQGKTNEALMPLEIGAKDSTADSETHYLLARVYQKLGHSQDAEREFAEAKRRKDEQLEKEKIRAPKSQ